MAEQKVECIAFHGWCLDASFWDPLMKELPNNFQMKAADRGYFAESNIPSFTNNPFTCKMLLVHSFGLHWCPVDLLRKADIIVLTGSFLSFLSDDKREEKAELKALKKMIARFKIEPGVVLQNFYAKAFYPLKEYTFEADSVMNHTLLLDDLNRMMKNEFNTHEHLLSKDLSIIHGTADQIVSVTKARKMKEALPSVSSYFELSDVGHLLPISDNKLCANKIEQSVKNYLNQA